MTRITQFVEAFWGPDFTCMQGFEALCKRMKIGRNTCKDLLDFFTARTALEKEYSAKLQRLAKSMEKKAHATGESSTLDDAIAELLVQADKIAVVHMEASKLYNTGVERLQHFHDTQKDEKKRIEENVKKYQSNKLNQYNKTQSLQKAYVNKCREMDLAKGQYESSKQSVTTQTKDQEKAKSKLDRSEQAMDQADSAYKSSIDNLEQARVNWEREMEEACTKFQKMEEERIEFLRNEMWVFCNTMSQACVEEDECCEESRQSLEKCSVTQDIVEFIEDSKTGTERPAKIEYQNHYAGGHMRKAATPPTGRHLGENRRNNDHDTPTAALEIDGGDYATIGDTAPQGALMPPRGARR